ncbi:unnamed protein product [Darwinula stevensoni]|uniref:Cytochrome P450 n=1 Tax=Darwinula stevensoni TaxID=69355 RepID=A0A7R8XA76_9CRUS|nr:unnamed protein product [Darwinula stevensoni]CAG0890363.1 unnamed protein product [Darwinula stevensoni]
MRKISDGLKHFEKQRIPTEKPLYPFVGNLWNIWKEVGRIPWPLSFEGSRPTWNIADPDLIRDICIKEFDHFTDRRAFIKNDDKVLSKMMTTMKGQEWKDVRSAVSPVFSSGKIKKMSLLMESCGETLVQHLREAVDKSQGVVDVKDQYGAYTLNVIATCAFGTKLDGLGKEDDPFAKHARKFLVENPAVGNPLILIPFIFPWMMKLMPKILPLEAIRFFRDLILDIMKRRKAEGNERGDALDAMMEQEEKEREAGGEMVITEEVIAAQSLTFFVAGFDTTASMMNFLTYILAIRPDIQDRLYEEIEKNVEERANEDGIQRIILMGLLRECTKDCIIDGIMEFKEGDLIYIPVYAVHHCPDYYPDPEVFDPDRFVSPPSHRPMSMLAAREAGIAFFRFSPEAKSSIPQGAYLPFGIGPRSCIGMRFALEEGKLALCHVIRSFRVVRCEETPVSSLPAPLGCRNESLFE